MSDILIDTLYETLEYGMIALRLHIVIAANPSVVGVCKRFKWAMVRNGIVVIRFCEYRIEYSTQFVEFLMQCGEYFRRVN